MEHRLDVRGLRCPVPYVRARALVRRLEAGDVLVVLATDPEAPVDIGALAADEGLAFGCEDRDGEWRLELRR
jgi:tRNA 2-thiouridine synthesizing protein A